MILWKFFPKRNLFSFFYIITESITHINFYYNNWDFISIFIKKKNIHCFQQWYENSPKSYPPRYHHQLDPNNKSVETRIQRVRHQWISPILPRYLPSSFAILLFARRKYGRESIISMHLFELFFKHARGFPSDDALRAQNTTEWPIFAAPKLCLELDRSCSNLRSNGHNEEEEKEEEEGSFFLPSVKQLNLDSLPPFLPSLRSFSNFSKHGSNNNV